MALPKWGSRRVTVEGLAYSWVVWPDNGFLVLVVQWADGPGQRLEAVFKYHDICEPAEAGARRVVGQRRSIRPGVVRAIILAALARGWQPLVRLPKAFRRRDGEQVVPLGKEEA